MSLENEYWTFKETLQNEEKKLKEYQAIEVKEVKTILSQSKKD